MRKILYIPLFVIISGLFTGCSEDYLNRTPSDAISTVSLDGSLDNTNALLLGIYKGMTLTRSATDDVGEISYLILNDIKGNDVIIPTNWYCYQSWFLRSQRAQTHARAGYTWIWAYNMINNCNYVIANAATHNDANWNRFQMEARTLRAYFYRVLLQHYSQHPRFAGLTGPGVPLSLKPATGNKDVDAQPRATIGAVYNAIIEDLTWAIQNGAVARSSKGRINTNVAQGLLARVYLDLAYADEATGSGTSQYWQKAITAAQAARTGYALMQPADYKVFNNINNNEWIWGLKQDGEGTISYTSFYSFYDNTTGRVGYRNFRASETFVTMFAPTDQRACFQNPSTTSDKFASITKFLDKSDRTGDLPYMRSAEMYLIEAECLTNMGAGNFSGAQNLLDQLRAKRIVGYTSEVPLATKNDMLIRIWVERRKELYGEGFAMPDINRLSFIPGIRITRSAYYFANIAAVPGDVPTTDNSWGFFQQIPKSEFDNNPKMNIDTDQNPLAYN